MVVALVALKQHAFIYNNFFKYNKFDLIDYLIVIALFLQVKYVKSIQEYNTSIFILALL